MKKAIVYLAFIGLLIAVASVSAHTQESPTIGEIQWKAQAIQNEIRYIQERATVLQQALREVQGQIKDLQSKQPTPKDPPTESIKK